MKKKKNPLTNYIIPGGRVDLQEVKDTIDEDDNGVKNKFYQTQVIDLVSEDRIEIAIPAEKSKLVLLPVNTVLDLNFFVGRTIYQCYGKVIDRYKSNNLYIMLVEMITNLRKHQRREYYRFSCTIEMLSRPLQEEEIQAMELHKELPVSGQPMQSSVIVDISGGGLRFMADYAYEVNSLILCKYQLWVEGENKEHQLVSKVLSVKEAEKRPGFYEHRVQYVNVTDEEREEIIKFIFGEERKLLKHQGK